MTLTVTLRMFSRMLKQGEVRGENVSIYEKREKLSEYCNTQRCLNCIFYTEDYTCGRGTSFLDRKWDGSFGMPDEMIIQMYDMAFVSLFDYITE